MPPLSPELKQLAKLLDKPRPQVLVVVGTGVAMGATDQPHASWLGLLKRGIRHLAQKQFQPQWGIELEASLDAGFSPFHLETALRHAELVEEALNMPNEKAFAQWLESAFANFKTLNEEKAKAPLEVLRDLHEAGALLLTTNYDSLLTDITGVPPVTWEEHADFHRVMTRQKAGILHIHGHWERPSSIVLGRTSYNRVVADEDLQQLFRALWLDWTWVYVGCGDGLDDPNLGRLLEWGRRWGVSALPDFFLAQRTRPRKSPTAQINRRTLSALTILRTKGCLWCSGQSLRLPAAGRSFELMTSSPFSAFRGPTFHFPRDRNTWTEMFLLWLRMPNCRSGCKHMVGPAS